MNTDANIAFRKATATDDGRSLAMLMNMAGDGLPAHLWSQSVVEAHGDVFDVGACRIAREHGDFSYRNTHVAVDGDTITGMLLGYRLPTPYPLDALDESPAVVRPLVELEACAEGSWYINAIATAPHHRGRGIGTRLMQLAEQLARDSGASVLSLIVADGNVGAKRLYLRLGYRVTARRPIVPYAGCPHDGDWLLMERQLQWCRSDSDCN